MNVAEYVSEYLVSIGCTHAFGVVGGANILLFEALSRKMKVVSTHHEQAAAMAATYYYRTCGRLAPCVVTAGAGSANAITGVMAAYFDSIPLLVLSGNERSNFFGAPHNRSVGFQGFDPTTVVRTFTKEAVRSGDAGSVRFVLPDLCTIAQEPRQGPVWLDIPQDIAGAAA